VKFIVDAQLPPALARLLRESGCDAFAVRDIGLPEANDAEIWRYAVQQQAAIITSASVRIKKLFQEISLVDRLAACQNHR
jgi:predicted nuclease of predicted toxin-antitoxin system